MAKSETGKVVLERTYTIPLRREFMKSPIYSRTKRAVSAIRNYLKKHMKSEDIKLGTELNEKLWKHGIKNPPARVSIQVAKDDKGVVHANLVGKRLLPEAKAPKKEKKSSAKKPETVKKEPSKDSKTKPAEEPEDRPTKKQVIEKKVSKKTTKKVKGSTKKTSA